MAHMLSHTLSITRYRHGVFGKGKGAGAGQRQTGEQGSVVGIDDDDGWVPPRRARFVGFGMRNGGKGKSKAELD